MRILITMMALMLIAVAAPRAENPTPYPGTKTLNIDKPFASYVVDLETAIKANDMGIVAQACADCGASKIGVTIPGNRVIMIFKPPYAVRMLEASVAAGIEAPLRLYVTEADDGTATLTYRLPSAVFAPYEVAELDAMAEELDTVVARIVADSRK